MKILLATKEGIHSGLEMKTRDEWLTQAKAAYAEWQEAGKTNVELAVGDLFACRKYLPAAAFNLIQALDALGQPIDAETRAWATSYGRSH